MSIAKAFRTLSAAALAALALIALAAPTAEAKFGLVPGSVDGTVRDSAGEPYFQAGGHPATAGVDFELNSVPTLEGKYPVSEEADVKDVFTEVPPGLFGNPLATPRCDREFFFSHFGACPASTQVGIVDVTASYVEGEVRHFPSPVYNLDAPTGFPAEFGFAPGGAVTVAQPTLRSDGDYGVTVHARDIPQAISLLGVSFTFWGLPADSVHDDERGEFGGLNLALPDGGKHICGFDEEDNAIVGPPCPSNAPQVPFLTNPADCAHGPFETTVRVIAWQGQEDSQTFTSHDNAGNPLGATGCESVPFDPSIKAATTSKLAESGTGLDFEVNMPNTGLLNPDGISESPPKRVEVTLPEGVTINPSVAEGLAVCTPADLKKETLDSLPGEGCPNASKLGSLSIKTPILEEEIEGSVFLAQQDDPATTTPGAENPFDSLIALYLVPKSTEVGVIAKLAVKVEPDPVTGQLVAITDDSPQVPFSRFKFHFREGARAALITPPTCGNHTTTAKLYPWSDQANPRTVTSSFEIVKGVDGGACPSGGVPPFKPDFNAGSLNNNAGSFSPFYMRLIRADGEQDMTKFSSILPPGEIGSLVGVAKCPDAAIAIARSKSGRQEIANPSCPAASEIGNTLAGAGVGNAITYVGGKIYLGGPYNGDPLSVIAITPAVAGPFDAGTVVVRLALTLNPKTAEVEVDGANSDPIPHILKGIVLKVRDLRVYVDRPNFTLNPTSCEESSARATLFGSYLDVFSTADDVPVELSDRFQAANCANLGFKPRLHLNLKGGTRRGGHPGLRALYRPRPGDANVKGLVVRLPRSAFLDQAHIRTICTRVQFAAKACPKAAQYGYIRAWTPLLEEPLQGPVYLRSSSHKLPDLVFDLHGLVDIEVATRIDSAKGGIRASLEDLPDAPLSKVVVRMQGGQKGLIVNSRSLCVRKSKADVRFGGQNGKQRSAHPVMRADCPKKRKRSPESRG